MMAFASPLQLNERVASTAARAGEGFTIGGVRVLLRLEGFAAFAAALALYGHAGFSWPVFALLFLAPDLSMLAYLGGSRMGAVGYNLAHTYAPALGLTLVGYLGGLPTVTAVGLVWIAHIGFDRALGYGLKYSTAFGDTHLGRSSRAKSHAQS
jgi:uncharacterized protein DUF4260